MESKREKIYDVIQDACNDMVDKWDSPISQETGIYEYADYIESFIDSEVEEQNATLIREHQLMKEALERITDESLEGWEKKIASETLKQITL